MIDYNEEWLVTLLFQVKGSVAIKASYWAIPAACLAFVCVCMDEWYPGLREDFGLMELSRSQLWSATTAILGMLLGFRTNRAMARFWEGTGLLHQMRGEWFDSISCCITFSIGAMAHKRKEVYRFRHTIVRLMSLCHGSALEEIAGGTESVATIDSMGLDNATLAHLKNCKEVLDFNRVEVLLHLTQSIITKSLDDGILKIPPPILSRVYQTLSRGFVNLLNAKKIADTRFPFPYAQLITIFLLSHLILTPLMISCLVKSKVWAPIFTFVPIFAMFSVNFVGVELENPFGTDDNDLPLAHFQGEMNKCLMMLLHHSADLIAGVSESRCVWDFDLLRESVETAMHDSEDANHKTGSRKSVSDFAKFVDIYADDMPQQDLFGEEVNPPEEKKLDSSPPRAAPPPKSTVDMSDYTSLRQLVETQVLELNRSIAALTEFSDALPGAIDTALLTIAGVGPSHWRTAMLRKAGDDGAPTPRTPISGGRDQTDQSIFASCVDQRNREASGLLPASTVPYEPHRGSGPNRGGSGGAVSSSALSVSPGDTDSAEV